MSHCLERKVNEFSIEKPDCGLLENEDEHKGVEGSKVSEVCVDEGEQAK